MEDMAGEDGITMPRVCGRQTSRSNVQASSPEEYWRRTIFVPFLDYLIQALSDRFTQLKEDATRGFQLLPKNAAVITPEDAAKICERFNSDLPSAETFMQEIRWWKIYWSDKTKAPLTLQATLASPLYSPRSYPNISTALHILSVTPVTSASTERANLVLKFVKNNQRSTMGQDRFNSLILLYVHQDIKLNYDAIVDMYTHHHPRRMTLINSL